MRHLVILVCLLTFQLHSQNRAAKLDSLLPLSKTQEKVALLNTMNEISWEYLNSNSDSSLFWAKNAVRFSKALKNQKSLAASYNTLATCYESLGRLDSAKVYHKKSLQIKLKLKDSIGIADSYNNLGIVFDEQADYEKALKYYFKALKIYENNSTDFQKVPMVYSNIGIVYKKQKDYKKVLLYYEKALKIYKEKNYEVGQTITKGNIATVLLQTKEFEKSLKYSTEAHESYEQLGYTRYIPYMLNNMAIAHDSLKNPTEARKFYAEAIILFQEDKNRFELAHAQIGYASNLRLQKDYGNALEQLQNSLEISRKQGFKELEIQAMEGLAKTHFALGDHNQAYLLSQQILIRKDSLFENTKTKSVIELETKYETKKKQNQILEQRSQLAENDLEMRKKNIFIYGSLGLAFILGLFGYLLYNQQKLKNRQLQKESELKAALAKIEIQNKLQEQRLRISRDLHDNIGAQLTFIISSVDNLKYAFTDIGENLGNKLSGISNFTSQTIYELRDTIWAMNKESITFEDLQTRIANFIEHAKKASELTEFSFNIDENVDQLNVFTSVQGMNIYRIIQEAVNNALKHASAEEIEVNISREENNHSIAIIDNGVGFNKDTAVLGNGFHNMKKRASEINGSIEIVSRLKKGTRVVFVFPSNQL